jgi:Zn-dependent peptidase ImmA (M78 family)/DNA-binding XRE family transcriptional regulator
MDRPLSVGANLRLARLFHGLTLEDVASRIGKSRQYVHKLETEQIEPPSDTLQQIADMTQVTPEFFVRAIPSPVTEEQCHFRKHFTARAAVKHVALAKGEMFRRVVSWLDTELELPQTRIPSIEARSLAEIEQAAEACRRQWGLGLGPIQDTIRLAEGVGAIVTTFRGVSREVDAYSIASARPVVVLNMAESSACRLRFDVAHELAHLVLHAGQVTGDRRSESEANRFAGALLLPRTSFVKEFPRLRGNHLNWQGLSEMKLRWRVSKSALLYRARQLGLISEDQYKTGVIRLARGGEARQEHEDGLMTKETPELFAHAISLLGSSESVALRVISKCLEIGPEIVREFLVPSPEPKPSARTTASTEGNVIEVQFGKRESRIRARPEAIEG